MKASTTALLAGASAVLAADNAPFTIPYMTTSQPNGNPAGQVNYYHLDFNVTSKNGDSPYPVGFCTATWGDNGLNCGSTCSPDSEYVPAGEWIDCTTTYLGTTASEFSFELSKPFSIGDFQIQLKQNFTQTASDGTKTNYIATSSNYTVSNSTSAYTCQINGQEVAYEQHAQGSCATGPSGFTIPVSSVEQACAHAKSVKLNWVAQETTVPGDNVFVVGNITQLGNWSPYHAVALSASGYTAAKPYWHGGNVAVPAGTPFEYKFIQWSHDGSLLWECGENWVATVDAYTCGTQTVGTDPTWFRCGNH